MGLVDRRPVVCRNLAMGFWVPLHSPFLFFVASSITYLSALRFPYREGVEGALVFFLIFFYNILVIPCAASCCRSL